MKQITFRQLQTNTSWLADLPIEVIRYGKVIARVFPPDKIPAGVTPKEAYDSTSQDEKNIQNDKKAKFLELKKALENNQPIEKPPEPPKLCKVPGCVRKGEWHTDMKFWNSANGEYDEIPGYYCDKHYQVNRRLV